MTEDLEAKLEEYRVWALTIGHYSSSTVTRSVRRIRELSKAIDVIHPTQKQVLDFFAMERMGGIKPHTMNNQRKDLDAFSGSRASNWNSRHIRSLPLRTRGYRRTRRPSRSSKPLPRRKTGPQPRGTRSSQSCFCSEE